MRKSTRRVSDYRILFVVNDDNMARELCAHFESHYHSRSEEAFYETFTAVRGGAALKICSEKHPLVAVIDVDLPDMNGYKLARRMRKRLGGFPVAFIFLVKRNRFVDKVRFPEFKGEYYVTKPFTVTDVEQVIRKINMRMSINHWRNPWTRLPSGRAVENELESLLNRQDWVLLYTSIDKMSILKDVLLDSLGREGFDLYANIIRSVADLVEEVIEEHGDSDDFIGHIAQDNFVMITRPGKSKTIIQQLCIGFEREIPKLYLSKAEGIRPLALSVFMIDGTNESFADTREISDRIMKEIS